MEKSWIFQTLIWSSKCIKCIPANYSVFAIFNLIFRLLSHGFGHGKVTEFWCAVGAESLEIWGTWCKKGGGWRGRIVAILVKERVKGPIRCHHIIGCQQEHCCLFLNTSYSSCFDASLSVSPVRCAQNQVWFYRSCTDVDIRLSQSHLIMYL